MRRAMVVCIVALLAGCHKHDTAPTTATTTGMTAQKKTNPPPPSPMTANDIDSITNQVKQRDARTKHAVTPAENRPSNQMVPDQSAGNQAEPENKK